MPAPGTAAVWATRPGPCRSWPETLSSAGGIDWRRSIRQRLASGFRSEGKYCQTCQVDDCDGAGRSPKSSQSSGQVTGEKRTCRSEDPADVEAPTGTGSANTSWIQFRQVNGKTGEDPVVEKPQ